MPPGARLPSGAPPPGSARRVFAKGLRGYVPAEVDAYVARLQAELDRLRAQAAAAHAAQAAAQARADEQEAAAASARAAQQHAEQALKALRSTPVPTVTPLPDAEPASSRPVQTGHSAPHPAPAPGTTAHAGAPPARRQRTRSILLTVAGGLLVLAVVVVALLWGDSGQSSTDAGSNRATAEPSATAEPPTAAPVVTGAPVVPEGWRKVTSRDGSAFALPTDWKQEGIGTGERFVSASGLAEVRLSSAPASSPEEVEQAFAGSHPGYELIGARNTTVRDQPAIIWDYTIRQGQTAQRGSDLAVLGGGLGYQLHVQSNESAWPSVEPLLAAIRGSFAPAR